MGLEQDKRVASIQQLLAFEEHKLYEFRRQQVTERASPHGHPENYDPDIRSCEEMIRLWTNRMNKEAADEIE